MRKEDLRFEDMHEFFAVCGEKYVKVALLGVEEKITVDELFHHFRERLLNEIVNGIIPAAFGDELLRRRLTHPTG